VASRIFRANNVYVLFNENKDGSTFFTSFTVLQLILKPEGTFFLKIAVQQSYVNFTHFSLFQVLTVFKMLGNTCSIYMPKYLIEKYES
jgi:hypothetical protein